MPLQQLYAAIEAGVTIGDLPILLTSFHDGKLTEFGPWKLEQKNNRFRDLHVNQLVLEIGEAVERTHGKRQRPSLFIQNVHRNYINEIVFNYSYRRIEMLVSATLEKHGWCLLIDFHGFTEQPKIGKFDLVLGTNHRQTVNTDRNIDMNMSVFFERKGYRVYTPSICSIIGERYKGQARRSIINFVHDRYSPKADAIQVEIFKDWRVQSEKFKKITEDFANFFVSIAV